MLEALTHYFSQNRQIVLPGIGELKAVYNPARYDAGQQLMLPPGFSFQWIPQEEGEMDSPQPLMAFLGRMNQWTEEESYEAMHSFGNSLRNTIATRGEWIWPGVGKLVPLNKESLGFVPEEGLDNYLTPIEAKRAIHTGAVHQMIVGDKETNTFEMQEALKEAEDLPSDKWWIPSLIMAILTLVLIILRLSGVI